MCSGHTSDVVFYAGSMCARLVNVLKDEMEKIYRCVPPEKIPWNIETPPDVLQRIVATRKITPCKVIELGCGIGHYVTYLARVGFYATGVDFSETAIGMARRSASEKELNPAFIVADVLGDMAEVTEKFDFAYDWELLHHIFPPDRPRYVHNVHRLLNPHGRYMSVSFSEKDSQFGGAGKYRTTPLGTVLYFSSEREIVSLVEPLFEVEELETIEIRGKFTPHLAIYASLKKKQ